MTTWTLTSSIECSNPLANPLFNHYNYPKTSPKTLQLSIKLDTRIYGPDTTAETFDNSNHHRPKPKTALTLETFYKNPKIQPLPLDIPSERKKHNTESLSANRQPKLRENLELGPRNQKHRTKNTEPKT